MAHLTALMQVTETSQPRRWRRSASVNGGFLPPRNLPIGNHLLDISTRRRVWFQMCRALLGTQKNVVNAEEEHPNPANHKLGTRLAGRPSTLSGHSRRSAYPLCPIPAIRETRRDRLSWVDTGQSNVASLPANDVLRRTHLIQPLRNGRTAS
jgi:hypothetical protein